MSNSNQTQNIKLSIDNSQPIKTVQVLNEKELDIIAGGYGAAEREHNAKNF